MAEVKHVKTRWAAIGTGLFSPTAIAMEPGQIVLFARGATGKLLYIQGTDTDWSEHHSLGHPVAYIEESETFVPADWPIAACKGEANWIHLFARSPDGELLHMTGTGNTWGVFECLGAPALMKGDIAVPMGLAGPPTACSLGPDRIDVYAVGPDGDLLHTSRNSRGWSPFESLGIPSLQIAGREQPVPLFGPVAACSCGGNRMGVFVRGARGDLVLKWWDGTRWSEFASLGMPEVRYDLYPAVTVAAPLSGPPAACSWGPERIDVFARGPAGDMLHKWWDGKDWSAFESLGMPTARNADKRIPFTGAIAACTWGEDRLDVFARALDGKLYHAWSDGTWDHN